MNNLSVMIKPVSGNCNLRCEYCFYYDEMSKRSGGSYGYMSEDTLKAVLSQVLAKAERNCSIMFQGGEPTLRGIGFFERALELEKKYNVHQVKIHNAIQTNGYCLNQKWADFFARNQFLVGVSLDGGPRVHDCYRRTAAGEGSFSKVMKSISLLREAGAEFNILCVVNDRTAPQIRRTYEFYKKNGLRYLQFIQCLDPLGEEPGIRKYALRPEVYGKFLIELFELWKRDLEEGVQPYIRQFENYIGILLGQGPEACDMAGHCNKQYVVEADGSVYCCDFYVLDEYRLGNFHTDTIEDMDRVREEKHFIENSLVRAAECRSCRYEALCRGGCRRTRQTDQGHRQYFCQSYRMFFDRCLPELVEIAQRCRR